MKTLESDIKPDKMIPNISMLLHHNVKAFRDQIVFQEKINGKFTGITWHHFYNDILTIAFNLKRFGFTAGDKMVYFALAPS